MLVLTKNSQPNAPETRRVWKLRKGAVAAALVVLVGIGLGLYPSAASWFAQREQAKVISMGLEAIRTSPNNDETYRAEQLALAHEYNDALASGAVVEANANIARGSGKSGSEYEYNSLLSVGTEAIMSRLKYENVGVDLPVFHGTSDDVLQKGIGHLEGTSLPVGGIGTRAVLTGHRGLANATMFTHLDRAEVGDTFTLETMGEVLTYRVVEIKVIAPEDTEELFADPTRDLVTLITCTPLGVNTHRILVTGERVLPTPADDLAAAGSESQLPTFPWWTVKVGLAVVAAVAYVWWAGYPPKSKKRRNSDTVPGPPSVSADREQLN